jgi:hypothetical protein
VTWNTATNPLFLMILLLQKKDDNLSSSVGILGIGMLKNCHHSLASCTSELMRSTTALAVVRTIRQCLTDEDVLGN